MYRPQYMIAIVVLKPSNNSPHTHSIRLIWLELFLDPDLDSNSINYHFLQQNYKFQLLKASQLCNKKDLSFDYIYCLQLISLT